MTRRLEDIELREIDRLLAIGGQTLWLVEKDGTILDVTGAHLSELGYTVDELRGSALRDMIVPAYLKESARLFESVADIDGDIRQFEIELKVLAKDGGEHDVRVNATEIADASGEENCLIGLTTDITRQKLAERTLLQERLRFMRTFENAPNGIILLHIDSERGGLIKGANAVARRITGRSQEELVGIWLIDGELTELIDAEVDEAFEQSREMLEGDGSSFTVNRVLKRPDGSTLAVKAAVSALPIEDWEVSEEYPVNAIVHVEDVTEQRHAESELQHQARHDSLTDLLNRRWFLSLLFDRLERSWHGHGGGALLMIDLDDFKKVNDAHGHIAGDGVLREVAAILRAELRDSDPIARIGGDEFAVLLPQADIAGALQVAEGLLERVRKTEIRIPGESDEVFCPSVSIGVLVLKGRKVDAEAAISDGDRAMYEAKRQGGDRYIVAPD